MQGKPREPPRTVQQAQVMGSRRRAWEVLVLPEPEAGPPRRMRVLGAAVQPGSCHRRAAELQSLSQQELALYLPTPPAGQTGLEGCGQGLRGIMCGRGQGDLCKEDMAARRECAVGASAPAPASRKGRSLQFPQDSEASRMSM